MRKGKGTGVGTVIFGCRYPRSRSGTTMQSRGELISGGGVTRVWIEAVSGCKRPSPHVSSFNQVIDSLVSHLGVKNLLVMGDHQDGIPALLPLPEEVEYADAALEIQAIEWLIQDDQAGLQ
jgi:hypothetical protein